MNDVLNFGLPRGIIDSLELTGNRLDSVNENGDWTGWILADGVELVMKSEACGGRVLLIFALECIPGGGIRQQLGDDGMVIGAKEEIEQEIPMSILGLPSI